MNWNVPAQVIVNQVRGLQPWPGVHCVHKGKALKICWAQVSLDRRAPSTPGEVVDIGKDGFTVATAQGAVLIKEVQPEAGKIMPAHSFVAGYKVVIGTTFS